MNNLHLIKLLFLAVLITGCTNPVIEKPPITPKWALGHIVWEDSINTRYAAEKLARLYREHNIPVDGIIIDSPWSQSYNDFNWDTLRYPNPSEMLKQFNTQNIRTILWMTGCVNLTANDVPVAKSPDYDFVIKNNYAVNRGNPSEWWKGTGVHIDFTNQTAKGWWDKQLDKVFTDGVSGWKVDQGEYYFGDSLSLTPENRIAGQDNRYFGDSLLTSKGRISLREFKGYYYDHMFDYTVSRKSDGVILARPFSHQGDFAANISKMSLGWSGDFEGNWTGLKLQINNIYRSARAGYGALACEIGGFYESRSSKKQLIRYTQFAAMTACMINGGQNGAFTNHLPWYHDQETADIFRYYVKLHKQLSPYIFSQLVDAHYNGGSLLKDASLERMCHKLGNDIFFKAITSDSDLVSFVLPGEDNWINFFTGELFKGGTEITKKYDISEVPIFIREGAILPIESTKSITGIGDESFENKITILIYPGTEKSHFVFHRPTGDGIEYEDITIDYNKGEIHIKSEKDHSFIFLVKSPAKPETVTSCDHYVFDPVKGEIKIEKKGNKFRLLIR